jgi:hypothetical protein
MTARRHLAVLFALVGVVLAARAGGVAAGQDTDLAAPQTLKKTMWGATTQNGQSLFPTYRDLGVGIFAVQARWEEIAPTEPADPTDPNDPAYVWPTYLDQVYAEAPLHGMEVQILVMGSPTWANEGRSWRWAPSDPGDYADFTRAVARRYPDVRHWMIWGEPNRRPNFGPFTAAKRPTGKLNAAQQRAPRTYARLLDAAYGVLKDENPGNLVIGGNTFTASGRGDINTYQWAHYMRLPGGKRPRMDMWGHNPWGNSIPDLKDPPSPRGSVTFSDLGRLLKVLDKNFKGQRLKLFLAEWGVPTGFDDKDLLYRLKAAEAARWIKAAFRITRTSKRIYSLGWIHPVDSTRNSTGLIDISGNQKDGVYDAYKAG